jgi:hypothetical protein
MADLQPYSCIRRDCPDWDRFFETKERWIDHTFQFHSLVWCCDSHCTHDDYPLYFSSEEEFRIHLLSHNGLLNENELEFLILGGRQRAVELFDTCPFCGSTILDLGAADSSSNAMENHICDHLLMLSLFALINDEDEENKYAESPEGKTSSVRFKLSPGTNDGAIPSWPVGQFGNKIEVDNQSTFIATASHIESTETERRDIGTPEDESSVDSLSDSEIPSSRTSVQDVEEELIWCLDDDEYEAVTKYRRKPESVIELPASISLAELLKFIYAGEVFRFLEVAEIIRLRGLSREFKQLVDNYVLHVILPDTYLTYRYKYKARLGDLGEPTDFEHLSPVIRRVEKTNRFLPHGRIVYEPSPDRKIDRDRVDEIVPHAIDLVLPDNSKHTWVLQPIHRPGGRPGRSTHMIYLRYTKIHQYYLFDKFNDPPVHVFYKDKSDEGRVQLHCISIPLDYLRTAVQGNYQKNLKAWRRRWHSMPPGIG